MVRVSRPEIIKTLRKLEALSVDLRLILNGSMPVAERLEDAPLLEEWRVAPAPFPILVGNVVGHPKLMDGAIMTSQLFLLDEQQRWARTFSRYYRLGISGVRD